MLHGSFNAAKNLFKQNIQCQKNIYRLQHLLTLQNIKHLINCYRSKEKFLHAKTQFMKILLIIKKTIKEFEE